MKNKKIIEEKECKFCKFFSNPRNNHLGYCVHKQNTDFRSKGERLHKRQKAKRCSPEFCPLKI